MLLLRFLPIIYFVSGKCAKVFKLAYALKEVKRKISLKFQNSGRKNLGSILPSLYCPY